MPFPYRDFEELKKADRTLATNPWYWASFDASEPDLKWLDMWEEGLEKDAENAKRKQKESVCCLVQDISEMSWRRRVVWKGKKMGHVVTCLLAACTSTY
jgi:HEPN domain-containing protein